MTRHDPAWLDAQYNNRARVPEHPQIFERWATRLGACARARRRAGSTCATATGRTRRSIVFPAPRANAPVLVFIHGGYWRALDKARPVVHRAVVRRRRRDGGGAQLRAVPGGDDRDDRAADGARRWPGPGAMPRCTAATRRASSWPGIRPAGTWPRCCWPATGSAWSRDLPARWCAARWRSRACTTWSRCATRRSCRTTCG